jgi:carboxyl-terminal processing protease
MKKILSYFAVIIATAIISISISSNATKPSKAPKVSITEIEKKLNDSVHFIKALELTKQNYVKDIEKKELVEEAIDGMLSSLDPHSGYLNIDDFNEMNVQTSGQFGGVGIEITKEKDIIKVISPIDSTPAFKAGIKPKDYIIKINNESVRNMSINDAVKKIRGPNGTYVTLTIAREGEMKPLDFKLKRAVIKIAAVKSELKSEDIAYFKIRSFSSQTTLNLRKDFRNLKYKNKNIKGVILDLRNNPGGLLNESISVSDLFLEKGVIVSTKGRTGNSKQIFEATEGDMAKDLPMIVLINQGSASASEIVAGALQDHKRAIVIGNKSFGKGSVQTIIPLNETTAIRLTTALYYTPSGKSIQAEGIVPNIIIDQNKLDKVKKTSQYSEANLPGHIENLTKSKKEKKKSKENITEIYAKDYQLARAIDLIHALAVYKN